MKRQWLVRAAAAWALVTVVATAASVWLFLVNRRLVVEPVHYLYGDAVAGLLYPIVGAYLVRRRPANLVGWVFVATSVLGGNAFANQVAVFVLLAHSGPQWVGLAAAWIATWGWAPALFVPTLLPLYFPDGTLPSPRWRGYARAVVAVLGLLLLTGMVVPAPIDASEAIQNPLGRGLPAWVVSLLRVPALLSLLVLTPVSVVALLLRLRRAAGQVRAQLAWLSFAALVAVACSVSSAALPDPWSEATWALASAAIPAGVVVAVVRHQLLDIEVVLPRAVVYVVLTGLLVAAYALAVIQVGSAAGQRAGIVAVALLALAAAALRNRLQHLVERLLYGERRDPFTVVRRLGRRLDAAAGPREALAELADEVRSSLRLPYLAVEPADPDLGLVTSGDAVADLERLPVTVLGQPAATLVVGLRRGTARLSEAERSVLQDVAGRAGALVQAVGLVEDLQRSRERIVTAREEERRRLRRDLHDGVGPQLAGMALQLDGLVGRLDQDPVLRERAEQIRDRMRSTVAEVRRVVDDLRPPALDQLGLVGALRQQADLYRVGQGPREVETNGTARVGVEPPTIEVEVEGEMPELSAAVEVAAYRIGSEALANAVRHARSQRCTVTLRAAEGFLLMTIRDDGTGIDPASPPHVGLLTMSERAEELGGRLSLESGAAGLSVLASLPLQVDR